MELLSQLKQVSDLHAIEHRLLPGLCGELRGELIRIILRQGGHFAGNLGVIELTVALHRVFSSPEDPIVWDVGHQAYPHKMLTGRMADLHTIRRYNGISGFPKRGENPHDVFGTGHSSTALSAALGMSLAASLKKEIHRTCIAVVGDGALTGGMAFEALNQAAVSKTRLLIVVNDNNIGIDPNTGAMARMLQEMEPGKPNWFTAMGFDYYGPADGHDVLALVEMLERLKHGKLPAVLHVKTIKGKGYEPAEKEQTRFHSAPAWVKLDPAQPHKEQLRFQDVFGDTLCELAALHPQVCGVTPAMPSGSGMGRVMQEYPDRFWDVGIAEQHAVTLCAGLAAEGMKPFCSVYSTFLQRGYDQLIHDVALQSLPVVFCIDRAGLVGEDGPTHHGSFDLAFLNPIPNLIIAAPRDEAHLRALMHTAAADTEKPWAIRYPRGGSGRPMQQIDIPADSLGKAEWLREGSGTVILALGPLCFAALAAAELAEIPCAVADMRFLKPLDLGFLDAVFARFDAVITLEDGAVNGGLATSVASHAAMLNYRGKLRHLGIPDVFPSQGSVAELWKELGYDRDGIAAAIRSVQP
jgi:1-deoxy-D-xylulose-5-phosphate synthase